MQRIPVLILAVSICAALLTSCSSAPKNQEEMKVIEPVAVSNYKKGFIDWTGAEAIPLTFEDEMQFHEGLAAVRQNGKWGFIDQTGKTVIEPAWLRVTNFSEGMAGCLNEYG